jgi:hypothetical protein
MQNTKSTYAIRLLVILIEAHSLWMANKRKIAKNGHFSAAKMGFSGRFGKKETNTATR